MCNAAVRKDLIEKSHGFKSPIHLLSNSNLNILNRRPQRDLAFLPFGRDDEVILQLHVFVGGWAQLSTFAHFEKVCRGQSQFHPCHMSA